MGGFSGFFQAIKEIREYAVPGGEVEAHEHYCSWAHDRLDGKQISLYVDYSNILRIACYSVEDSVSKLFLREGDGDAPTVVWREIAEAFVRQVDWIGAPCAEVVLVLETNYSHGKLSTATRVMQKSARVSDGIRLLYNSTAVGHAAAGRAKINGDASLVFQDYVDVAKQIRILKPEWSVRLVDGAEADGGIVQLIAMAKEKKPHQPCAVLAADSDFLVFSEMGRAEGDEDLVYALYTPTKRYLNSPRPTYLALDIAQRFVQLWSGSSLD
jgi:hypothetical protein